MKIAVASGKGGTGKTTVAVNLALAAASSGESITLLDCDVEEPNCHIFLKPEMAKAHQIAIFKPKVLEARCTACGICADVCEYGALMVLKDRVLVFRELCRGCGACLYFCPEGAIEDDRQSIGDVEEGSRGELRIFQGRLRIGEVMTASLIRKVKEIGGEKGTIIIDCPPGTSCPVIEAVRGTDFVLLVTEPTPFGLSDLALAVEMLRQLSLPFGAAVNRCDAGDDAVTSYLQKQGIKTLLTLKHDRRIAEHYARGEVISEKVPSYAHLFAACWQRIVEMIERSGERRPAIGVRP